MMRSIKEIGLLMLPVSASYCAQQILHRGQGSPGSVGLNSPLLKHDMLKDVAWPFLVSQLSLSSQHSFLASEFRYHEPDPNCNGETAGAVMMRWGL